MSRACWRPLPRCPPANRSAEPRLTRLARRLPGCGPLSTPVRAGPGLSPQAGAGSAPARRRSQSSGPPAGPGPPRAEPAPFSGHPRKLAVLCARPGPLHGPGVLGTAVPPGVGRKSRASPGPGAGLGAEPGRVGAGARRGPQRAPAPASGAFRGAPFRPPGSPSTRALRVSQQRGCRDASAGAIKFRLGHPPMGAGRCIRPGAAAPPAARTCLGSAPSRTRPNRAGR